MAEHGKIEHQIDENDALVQDSTESRPEVDEAFDQVDKDLEEAARQTYRELFEAA